MHWNMFFLRLVYECWPSKPMYSNGADVVRCVRGGDDDLDLVIPW